MLQRAASNAYSWWWASHIRTKQSKWLEQSLQDMEEKVTAVLKLIEEDGDSFAKRAEMYYKKRPEIIHFVEESYRVFRALAERYDLMSKELQNANSTLASAFPDQFQYDMDDDEEGSPQVSKRSIKQNPNIPNVPKHFPTKKIKALMALTAKNANKAVKIQESGMSKGEAIEEIDKLQKSILTKQTEKEFTKSSYESAIGKYWEIEQEITEMQQRVSKLQDEFGVRKEIEDNEARTLMLESALKSCHDTLAVLQEKQEKSVVEVRGERQKIKDARNKLMSFKGEILGEDMITEFEQVTEQGVELIDDEEQFESSSQVKVLEMLRDKIKEQFEMDSSVSVSEMADKIDELVNKVINLETAVSSQTAVIQRLRVETDELNLHIQSLEHDKTNLIDGKNSLSDKLKEMEGKLKKLQELEHNVVSRNTNLQMQFTDASLNLDEISQTLPTVKLDEEIQQNLPTVKLDEEIQQNLPSVKLDEEIQQNLPTVKLDQVIEHKDSEQSIITVAEVSEKLEVNLQKTDVYEEEPVIPSMDLPPAAVIQQEEDSRKDQEEDEPNWQQLFMNGLEGKEKVILNEYTTILRNYKEVKKRLSEVENKSEVSDMELRELKHENDKKDEEIGMLRQRLVLVQQKLEEYKNMKEDYNAVNDDAKEDDVISFITEEPRTISPIEEKLRADIDEILEENLDFWMRFGTSFSQVQKHQSEIEDLQKELTKMEKEKKKKDGSSTPDRNLKSDTRPTYKHLKEIKTELTVWLEKSVELKDELKCRFSQLCRIQEDITRAVSDGAVDDEMKFTSYQAAKFQGEVLNMQQENNKVEDELQAAVEHVSNLQSEVERTINRLNEELGISGSKSSSQMRDAMNRNRIPLRAFIFGNKTKKPSLLSSMQPSWHKKH